MRYVLVVLLAGCVAPQPQPSFDQQLLERAQYRCSTYGFRQGTPEFQNCVMQVDQSVRQSLRDQILRDEAARQQRSLPLCSQLPPGTAGYARAQGSCR